MRPEKTSMVGQTNLYTIWEPADFGNKGIVYSISGFVSDRHHLLIRS